MIVKVEPYPICAIAGGYKYMAQKKQFKDLNLSNAFLFAAALEDAVQLRFPVCTAGYFRQ